MPYVWVEPLSTKDDQKLSLQAKTEPTWNVLTEDINLFGDAWYQGDLNREQRLLWAGQNTISCKNKNKKKNQEINTLWNECKAQEGFFCTTEGNFRRLESRNMKYVKSCFTF